MVLRRRGLLGSDKGRSSKRVQGWSSLKKFGATVGIAAMIAAGVFGVKLASYRKHHVAVERFAVEHSLGQRRGITERAKGRLELRIGETPSEYWKRRGQTAEYWRERGEGFEHYWRAPEVEMKLLEKLKKGVREGFDDRLQPEETFLHGGGFKKKPSGKANRK